MSGQSRPRSIPRSRPCRSGERLCSCRIPSSASASRSFAPFRPGNRARKAAGPIILNVARRPFQKRPMKPAYRASSRCRKSLTAEIQSGAANGSTPELDSPTRISVSHTGCETERLWAQDHFNLGTCAAYGDKYKYIEREARSASRGMWGYAEVFDPRAWRHKKWRKIGGMNPRKARFWRARPKRMMPRWFWRI